MGIDHFIDWDCVPKQTLTTPGILSRLKARERAAAIFKLYRDKGDQRPASEMGFEMVRRMPDGTEDTRVVIVQTLIDDASQLDPLAHHCEGCPANRRGQPYGCFDYINYPITRAAELWLLKQLPGIDEPLSFLLLNQTVREFAPTGERVMEMRAKPGVFFQTAERFGKNLEDVQITTDQVFEMLFLNGTIQPQYAALLLVFFGAIPRDMDADALMALTEPGTHEVEFLMKPEPDDDDESIIALQVYFEAMFIAYQLGVSLSLDV